jgi:tRNA (guanine37-N1)-methyltransferase
MAMQFSVLTLFPDLITHYTQASIVGRAVKSGVIGVNALDIRAFSTNPHRKVDDTPYGGGAGMVMACQPVVEAYRSLLPLPQRHRVLLTSPIGRVFNHTYATELAETCESVVVLCGHYEGFDERITQLIPNLEAVSVGDVVLTGGELPALTIIDAVTRLLPGSVKERASVENDSFFAGLLDFPHYTRPAVFEGLAIPALLQEGNHAKIAQWRRQQALHRTWLYRPDLLATAPLTLEDKAFLKKLATTAFC